MAPAGAPVRKGELTVKIDKIPAAAIGVCIMGFASDEHAVKAGARLRGNHPAVLSHPVYFVQDGLSDDEMRAVLNERFPGAPVGMKQ